jgi:hypothetical protein
MFYMAYLHILGNNVCLVKYDAIGQASVYSCLALVKCGQLTLPSEFVNLPNGGTNDKWNIMGINKYLYIYCRAKQ